MKIRAFSLGFIVVTLALPVYAVQQAAVGKISFAKGSNAAQQPNAAPRLLGKDADVFQGDNIQTSDASFVMVEFIDGSKVTVRPNSNFKIEKFDTATQNAKFTVYEGGVRASTGEIAKASPDGFQIKTPTATLKGEKDSDYSVRVCKDDCDKDKKSEPAKDNSVAKVVDIKGDVFAQNRDDKTSAERKLSMGGGLNPHDYLTSQASSYLVMVFRDGEKVTLQPSSELDIVKYDFQQADKKDQILLKLAAGGMRALTGSIGKKDHSAYALDTPVATIGIRGTESETVIDDAIDVSTGHAPVYNHVTEGAIFVQNEAGEITLKQGESSVTASPNTPSIQIPSLPPKLDAQLNATPSPKTAPDADKAFDKPAASNSKSGSYVTVNKGSGKLESNSEKSEEKDDKTGKTEKNSSEKNASFDEKNVSSKDSNEKNDSKSNAPNVSSNDDSGGGGKSSEDSKTGSSMRLSEGESSFSGKSGEKTSKLDEIPTFIAQDEIFTAPVFDNNSPAAAATFSPLQDNGAQRSGAGCTVE